jgi:hypothetical protein
MASIVKIGPSGGPYVELNEDNGDLILSTPNDVIDASNNTINNVANLIEAISIEDSGAAVLDTDNLNFANNLNVTDDGDGTVTIDAVDTDTRTDVSDGGTTVVAETTDINFTQSNDATVSVTDDGDGSVTVDVDVTDTDTRTDVSDSGTQVLTDTTDINFSSNLTVTDDGDGSVTVDASGGGGVSKTTARRYGLLGGT